MRAWRSVLVAAATSMTVVLPAAALVAFFGIPAAPAGAQTGTGRVTLVHGVRGLVADVSLDGVPVLKVFEPERITDPLQLAAGDHLVEVRPSGAGATSAPLLSATLTVVGGVDQSAVVHLDAAGAPALSVFTNPAEAVPTGAARVTVRHVAAAPALQVAVDGQALPGELTNGAGRTEDVAAGAHLVSVVSGGATLLAPREVAFAEGTATALYLVGSVASGNLLWLAESMPAQATAPAAVRTGNSLVAGDQGWSWSAAAAALTVSAVGMVACGALFRRRMPEHRTAGGAAAGLAGLALGVTTLAATGRAAAVAPGPATRSMASLAAFDPPVGKVLGTPVRKPASLTVPPASRPAGLDHRVVVGASRPVMVAVEPGGVVATVEARGADPRTGDMDIPADPRVVGWYEHGPGPGDEGAAVLAGHVAYDGRPGAFAGLAGVEPGAVVLVTFDDGRVRTFRVDERRQYAKGDLPTDELFRRQGPAALVLITCGGSFVPEDRAYSDNVVLVASPLS